ncbi:hypothetical protein [Planctomyces sp. SH-PL62]|uniref:hypothetical protein n=1 Tax=Planctomyces sp. SH-PL62 TaxID=1636152 RepID=UPI00078E970B|nr:hypothetical protein [Planctomyces sp. SH-PL62]AMV37056.1 hypothetical protein VT85_06465 [Planctomyces sp. SH-PL62]
MITSESDNATSTYRADLLVAGTLGLAMFLINLTLLSRFDRLGVFEEYDVLFNTDPSHRLELFSSGWTPNSNPVHPGLGLIASLPIRLVALLVSVITTASSWPSSELEIRRELALLLIPALSGGTISTVYMVLRKLALARGYAVLMCLLQAASFSQLIFGSIPDHFVMSGFFFALAAWLAASTVDRGWMPYWLPWIVVGTGATCVTVTNLVIIEFFLLASLVASGIPFPSTARLCVGLAGIVLGVTGLVFAADNFLYGRAPMHAAIEDSQGFVEKFRDVPSVKVRGALPALQESLAPLAVATTMNPMTNSKFYTYYEVMFTLDQPRRPFVSTAFAALLALDAWFCRGGTRAWRAMGIASLLIIGFNLTAHTFWGDEFFLYSQHWLVAITLLLAAPLARGAAITRWSAGISLGILASEIYLNYKHLERILEMLRLY